MNTRKKPNGFKTVHDKYYYRNTLKFVRRIMKHFKSYKNEEDGN